ncbi:MAG: hypothetical protein AAF679_04830, partial [Pseudomonadota bacterium]
HSYFRGFTLVYTGVAQGHREFLLSPCNQCGVGGANDVGCERRLILLATAAFATFTPNLAFANCSFA